MSVDAAIGFVKRIGQDDELLSRVAEAPDGDARVALAESEGFTFDAGELEEALGQVAGTPDDVMDFAAHIIRPMYGAPSFFSEGPLDHDPFWTRDH